MIKVGDKVAPFHRMGHTGTVVELISVPVKTWMVGGAPGRTFHIKVMIDATKELEVFRVGDLMRVD
jgi:hypothetical protein